jgi:hypothetical protein
VRNEKGEVVGAFCVNFDVTDFLNSVSLLADFAETANNRGVEEKPETFASSVNETIQSLLDQGAQKIGKQPGTMSKEEKVQLVGILEYHGAFLWNNVLSQKGPAKKAAGWWCSFIDRIDAAQRRLHFYAPEKTSHSMPSCFIAALTVPIFRSRFPQSGNVVAR